MNDHDLEQALRDWIEADSSVVESPELRSRVMAIADEPAARSPRVRLLPTVLRAPRSTSSAALVAAVLFLFSVALFPLLLLGPDKQGDAASERASIAVAQDGSGDHETIAEAVAASIDGDTIEIQAGTYRESIVVDKDITLRGESDRDRVVIEAPGGLPDGPVSRAQLPFALRLEESHASVSNMTFRGPGSAIDVRGGAPRIENVAIVDVGIHATREATDSQRPVGLSIDGDATAELRDSVVQQADVIIIEGSAPVILNNDLERSMIQIGECCRGDRSGKAERAEIPAGDAQSIRPQIRDNRFRESWTAIWIGEGMSARIEDNEIVGAESAAAWLGYVGRGSSVRGNTIRDSQTAIMVVEGSPISIDQNVVAGNDAGIVMSGTGSILRSNVVRDNKAGIVIGSTGNAASPTLEGNTVSGNVRGVAIMSGSNPVLTGNAICDNGTNIVAIPDSDVWSVGNEECAESGPRP